MEEKYIPTIKTAVEKKIETATSEQIVEIAEVLEIEIFDNDWWEQLPDEQKK